MDNFLTGWMPFLKIPVVQPAVTRHGRNLRDYCELTGKIHFVLYKIQQKLSDGKRM